MHDKITVVQVGEINVERGAGGLGVRRLLASRTLDFIAAENFCIGHDDNLGVVADKTASEGTDLDLGRGVGFVSRLFEPQARRYTEFFPDFLKALAFAVVVAENMNGIILSQPAVDLGKKFTALRFGDLRFRRAFAQRTKSVERCEEW